MAQLNIFFPATVPSMTPMSTGIHHRWGVYEPPTVWSPDGAFYEPRLASDWSVDASGTTYTLKVTPGVSFHGGWGEVTADDFKWTFDDQIKDESIHSNIGNAREFVRETKVVDKLTFQVALRRPSLFFFDNYFGNTGGGTLVVESKKRVQTLGAEKANLDISGGTGPFRFVKWEQGTEVVLEAVPNHWRKTAQFKTIRIVEMKEAASQVAAMETGEVDVAFIPPPLIERVKKAGLEVRPTRVPAVQRLYPQGQFCMDKTLGGKPVTPFPRPGYDTSKPWVGDCTDSASMERARQVRWAMSMAIDRQAIATHILAGYGKPSYMAELTGPLLDQYFKPKYVVPYDPKKAKEMLANVGYANGFDATLWTTTGEHPLELEMGQAIAQYLQSIGIRIKSQVTTYSGFRPSVVARERSDLWFRSGATGSGEAPETAMLKRAPENAFNPGFEVVEPLAIIAALEAARSDAEVVTLRERLYDWFAFSQQIIGVVLSEQVFGVSKKVGQWKMSSGVGSLGDFEYAERK